jgi:SagB-type dehydrogenase family enzyme
MLKASDPLTLPILYHLNSEPRSSDPSFVASGTGRLSGPIPDAPPDVVLPPVDRAGPLAEAFLRRRSGRVFALEPIPLRDLSDALGLAYGVGSLYDLGDGRQVFGHLAPSAGGLYPLRLYVSVGRVLDLASGLYRYRTVDHALDLLGRGPAPSDLAPLMFGQTFVHDAGAVVLIAAEFERTLSKYGPRGYRYCLIEAGHVAQNLCLATNSRRLASVCLGGYSDAKVNASLQLDGTRSAVIYAVALGVPVAPADGYGPV